MPGKRGRRPGERGRRPQREGPPSGRGLPPWRRAASGHGVVACAPPLATGPWPKRTASTTTRSGPQEDATRRLPAGDRRATFLPLTKSIFSAPHFYGGAPAARPDRLSPDAEHLDAFLRDPACRVVPLWGNRHLIAAECAAVVRGQGES